MRPQFITGAAWTGNLIERLVNTLRGGGADRAPVRPRIVTYRSLGCSRALTVRGRLVRQADSATLHGGSQKSASQQLVSVYRAFDIQELPGRELKLETDNVVTTAVTDRGGYFEANLAAPPQHREWSPGWHTVRLSVTVDGHPVQAECAVQVPDESARLLLISDLDDTAMDSDTVNTFRMLRTVLLRDAERRNPVPGVPALYSAISRGKGSITGNPVCYISSGAWNLYDFIVDYLDTYSLPQGGIWLTDWGSTARRFRAVANQHKNIYVAELMLRYPCLSLLLVGDDTQEDPELYSQLASEHQSRVAGIWIRKVHRRRRRQQVVELLGNNIRGGGVDFIYAAESDEFMSHALARGWIEPECAR